ncbi:unnamed protein product [Caenorhabditis angaria]|uniref:G-protein coupled receptors family 1 profile domain-containing protein n=1 Tax=Caenorhabditis angaria TaxID=860376 RepID=A0A9P1I967_9PELO|nr:unnamed protein product [Caenorhabditis angaria]
MSNETILSCNLCLGSVDPEYFSYNLAVSGVLLPIIGVVGLIGNILVVLTYLHPDQNIHSTSIYLAALAFSDFFLILTAIFLFCFEAWRHHNHELMAWLYVTGAPMVFPIASIFQTSSVYFCVAAAVDCFIIVVLPESVKTLYCTTKRAKVTCAVLMVLCIVYNLPHFLELESVRCRNDDETLGWQICPTTVRTNEAYYTIYYTYMYTTFLAIGPLALLILLNICVVYTVFSRPDTEAENEGEDITSLILVVFFFIFCNFTALLVNFMELILQDGTILVYFVDLSNLLVVVNGTANFFCYLIFGTGFRITLKKILYGEKVAKYRASELWSETHTHALI